MKRYQKISIISCSIIFLVLSVFVLSYDKFLIDEAVYNYVISFKCSSVTSFFRLVTCLGNTITILLLLGASLFLFKDRRGTYLCIGAFLSFLINTTIKHLIRRPRPNHLRLIKQGGFSYPSGHAMIAICFYGLLLYFVYKSSLSKEKKIILITFLLLLILLIGLSRIYVGVHYPSDILAGYLLSAIILITLIYIYEKKS